MIPFLWLAGAIAAFAVLLILGARKYPDLIGFRGKTVWDGIELLLIPVTVGIGGIAFSLSQNLVEQERAKEEGLARYFDRVTALILDHPESMGNVDAVVRAHTLAVLRGVEGERAGRVLGFLADMKLLAGLDLPFEGLDLRGAELKGMNLSGLDFEGVDLTGADMEGANLVGVDFEGARLVGADLKGADLRQAGFEGADLDDADLDHANLREADLGASLSVTEDQLGEACFDTTTRLPPRFDNRRPEAEGCHGSYDDD